MSEEGEGFLSRWSRRKRAVVEGRAPEEAPPPAPLEAKPEALPTEPEDEFDLASLPPIESLTIESDFKAFLHRKVPLELRSAALRRAWSLDPAIRDFIGPADYAWDFNAPDGVPRMVSLIALAALGIALVTTVGQLMRQQALEVLAQ